MSGDKTNAENNNKMMVSRKGSSNGGSDWDRRRKTVLELTWENGRPSIWAPDYHTTSSANSSISHGKPMPSPRYSTGRTLMRKGLP